MTTSPAPTDLPSLPPTSPRPAPAGPGLHRSVQHDHVVTAPPEALFPLLCPVVEYEWIPTWDCTLVHTASGIAEHGCVFTTRLDHGEETWVCTTYRPPTEIEYTRVARGDWVTMLRLELAPTAEGTALSVRQTYTALTPEGERAVAAMSETTERSVWTDLSRLASVYLATGSMGPA